MLAAEFDIRTVFDQPFPGLRSFEPHESFLFFGRRVHTQELLRRLSMHRMLAVVGTSGSGKSSLVRAGLVPALQRGHLAGAGSRWRIAIMRPGSAPLDELTNALGAAGFFEAPLHAHVRDTIGMTSLGLLEAVRECGLEPNESLLLVVDQFEELFRFRRERERQDGGAEAALFVGELLEAVDQMEVPIFVVLTMRSDFLGDCAQFAGLPEALNRSQYLVPRLTREQRQEAIEGPLRIAMAQMSPRLVQRLLNDAGDDPDQLPVLQHALMVTFRKWKQGGGRQEIDLSEYEAAGGMADALDHHAEEVFQKLSSAEQECAQRIFRCLTTSEGGRAVRRPARLERIMEVVGASGDPRREAMVRGIIERFAAPENSFVVVNSAEVVDISHESLIRKWTRLQEWARKEAESAEWYQSLVRTARLNESNDVGLLRDPDLKHALRRSKQDGWNEAWAAQYCPGFDRVSAFLQRSRKAQRRTRALIGGVVVLILAAAGAGYWKYREDVEAGHQALLAAQSKYNELLTAQEAEKRKSAGLAAKLAQASDPTEKLRLQTQLEESQATLTKLQASSAQAKVEVSQRVEKVADDPHLLEANKQIDSLQQQLGQVRTERDVLASAVTENIASVNMCGNRGHCVSGLRLSPMPPATIPVGQRINISFNYSVSGDNPVLIFFNANVNGKIAYNSATSGSPSAGYTSTGSGTAFIVCRGPGNFDQMEVQVTALDPKVVLMRFYVPIAYQCAGSPAKAK
jgi:hypothetical protein